MKMTKNKLLRVTQMNAIYLDNEIYNLFTQLAQDTLKYLPPSLTVHFQSEVNLLIRLAIVNFSVVKSDSTFGQQLLSIKYDNISSTKKVFYLLWNCMDYLKSKTNTNSPYYSTISNISSLMKVLDFLNISLFLRYGGKPLLIERFLCLNQVYCTDNVQRQFESKYLARELLWNGFIEIIVNILPLINYHKLKRTIKHLNPFYKRSFSRNISNCLMTMHTKCAYCGESPILPHHMGCEHVFCYVCLKGNQAADSKYECPMCEHRNPNILCDRVSVM